ncbi:50S ribosomal protein L4 [Candidatus Falkowbacteria bacterium]|nr:50S ribosomal protein L4 [Candidatus Falkowbacteria bacterium]
MQKVKVYNMSGEVVGEEKLDPALFEVEAKEGLIHQAVVAQMANRRQVLAHTKDRGEVSGGGIKPWKQKGTGRARQGSIRSPLWVGGGVVFGPRNDRNFHQKINKKMKRKALLMCLSDRAKEEKIVVLDKLELDNFKTKKFLEILNKLPNKDKKTLLILVDNDKKIIKSAANLPRLKTIESVNLNVVDVLNHEYLMLPLATLQAVQKNLKK